MNVASSVIFLEEMSSKCLCSIYRHKIKRRVITELLLYTTRSTRSTSAEMESPNVRLQAGNFNLFRNMDIFHNLRYPICSYLGHTHVDLLKMCFTGWKIGFVHIFTLEKYEDIWTAPAETAWANLAQSIYPHIFHCSKHVLSKRKYLRIFAGSGKREAKLWKIFYNRQIWSK